MRHCITAPLERHKDLTGDFATEPYECGWAAEAIFFLRVQELTGEGAALTANVQISADGIHWVDEGTLLPPVTTTGDSFLRITHFGGWLRLTGRVDGIEARMNVMIHLVLKS